jgi:hypothetical protein
MGFSDWRRKKKYEAALNANARLDIRIFAGSASEELKPVKDKIQSFASFSSDQQDDNDRKICDAATRLCKTVTQQIDEIEEKGNELLNKVDTPIEEDKLRQLEKTAFEKILTDLESVKKEKEHFLEATAPFRVKAKTVEKTLQTIMDLSRLQAVLPKLWGKINEKWQLDRGDQARRSVAESVNEFFNHQKTGLQQQIVSLQAQGEQNSEEDDKATVPPVDDIANRLTDLENKFLTPLHTAYFETLLPLQVELREYWELMDASLKANAEHGLLSQNILEAFDEKVRNELDELFILFDSLQNAEEETYKSTIKSIAAKITDIEAYLADSGELLTQLTPRDFHQKLQTSYQNWDVWRTELHQCWQSIDKHLRRNDNDCILSDEVLEFLDEEMQESRDEVFELFDSLQQADKKERKKIIGTISEKIAGIESRLEDIHDNFLRPLQEFNTAFIQSASSRESYDKSHSYLNFLWKKIQDGQNAVLAVGIKQIETETSEESTLHNRRHVKGVPVPELLNKLKSIKGRYPSYVNNIQTLMTKQLAWLKLPLKERKKSTPPLVIPSFAELRKRQTKVMDNSEESSELRLQSDIYLSHVVNSDALMTLGDEDDEKADIPAVSSDALMTLSDEDDEKADIPEHPFVEVYCYLSTVAEYLMSAVTDTTQEVAPGNSVVPLKQELKELQPDDMVLKLDQLKEQIETLLTVDMLKTSLQGLHDRYVRMFNGQEDDSIPMLCLPTKIQLETPESLSLVIKSLQRQVEEIKRLLAATEKERESEELTCLSSGVEQQLTRLERTFISCKDKLTFLVEHNLVLREGEITVGKLQESINEFRTEFDAQLGLSAELKKVGLKKLRAAISGKQQQLDNMMSAFYTKVADVNNLIQKNSADIDRLVKFDPVRYKKTEEPVDLEEYKETDDNNFKSFKTAGTLAKDVAVLRLVAESEEQKTVETELRDELARIHQVIEAVNSDVTRANAKLEAKEREVCQVLSEDAWRVIQEKCQFKAALTAFPVDVNAVTQKAILEKESECVRRETLLTDKLPAYIENLKLIREIREGKSKIYQQSSGDAAWKVINKELMDTMPHRFEGEAIDVDTMEDTFLMASMTSKHRCVINNFLAHRLPGSIKNLEVITRAKTRIAAIRNSWPGTTASEITSALTEAEKFWDNAVNLIVKPEIDFLHKIKVETTKKAQLRQMAETTEIKPLVTREMQRILEHISFFLITNRDEDITLETWLTKLLQLERQRHAELLENGINSVIKEIEDKHCNSAEAEGLQRMKQRQSELARNLDELGFVDLSSDGQMAADSKEQDSKEQDSKEFNAESPHFMGNTIHLLLKFRCANDLARKTSENLHEVARGKTSDWLKWFRALIDFYHYWRSGKTESYSACSRHTLYTNAKNTMAEQLARDSSLQEKEEEKLFEADLRH